MVCSRRTVAAVVALILLAAGCDKKPPNRDHIPVLRQRLYDLQVSVAEKNRTAIDSLLSVSILENNQSSDSLLKFIYNYNDSYFPFERFGNYAIMYTDKAAQIECFIMDSAGTADRPVVLTLVFEHDLWLLKKFEAGEMVRDSM